jgi:endonuclease/exonuclease/phosphatase family metal-dependent hydrolase
VFELDGLSRKGFLVVHLTGPNQEHVVYIDAHTQSQYSEKAHTYPAIRTSQLRQINEYVRDQILAKDSNARVILSGDLNTMPDVADTNLFAWFVTQQWTDATYGARADCLATHPDPCGTHFDGHELSTEWIDHVLVGKGPTVESHAQRIGDDSKSDHLGIFANMTITY